jgi:uroporphyrinogen decarboxylase
VPITVYANGSGGLLERLGQTGADVVGLDWTVDMADARRRLGPDVSVQVCVQPTLGPLYHASDSKGYVHVL